MKTWYAVVVDATGEAISFGTDLADPLPAGCVAVIIDHQPDIRDGHWEQWDPKTRTVVVTDRAVT